RKLPASQKYEKSSLISKKWMKSGYLSCFFLFGAIGVHFNGLTKELPNVYEKTGYFHAEESSKDLSFGLTTELYVYLLRQMNEDV
ncbi:hypothetical protein, partial [Desemzia sp. FAM 23991]|uniref:hypothetical protein n=1 Tax=unclassified Desemzia TaxID=2685243 RepID=UPI003883886F